MLRVRIRNFIIRNFPVKVRQLMVKARNIGRKVPSRAIVNGKSYQVVPHVFWISFNKGKWEPDLRDFFGRTISSSKTVLDIGGWQGASLFLALSYSPQKVIVVEGNPETFDVLRTNCEKNNLGGRVELHYACLSDETGKHVQFGTMDKHIPHSAIHGIGGDGREVETVSCVDFLRTLDFSDINIVKIDIEGGERFFSEGLAYLSAIPGLSVYIALHPPFWPDKEKVTNTLIDVFRNFQVFNSREQPLSYNELESQMLSSEKTGYPGKNGRFFDIILKTNG